MNRRYEYVSSLTASLDAAMEAGTLEEMLDQVWNGYRKQVLFDEMK